MTNQLPPQQLKNSSFVKLRKESKKPFEKDWPNKPYSFDEIQEWILGGNNYGILGGYNRLCIVDADHPDSATHFLKHFPKTFVVRTPGKGYHFYFLCTEYSPAKLVLDKNGIHYGEVIGKGSQAVGPGSIHPDKKKPYEVFQNELVAEISADLMGEILSPFITTETVNHDSSGASILKILEQNGIILNPVGKQLQGEHPIHGSTNGKNFSVNPEKNCFYCFRHHVGGGPLQLIALLEKLIDCETLQKKGLSRSLLEKAKRLAITKYQVDTKDAVSPACSLLDENEIEKLQFEIKNIPSDTSHVILPQKIDHVLEKLSQINPAQADAILKGTIKEHFHLTNDALKKYETIIRGYAKSNKKKEEVKLLSEDEAKEILKDEKQEVCIHPAQDYKNGKMYFGVKIDEQPFIVDSSRKLTNFFAEEKPFSLKHTALDTSRFSYVGIDAFIGQSKHSIPIMLFENILKYLARFVVFPHQQLLHFVAIWAMGTYVYRIFRYYPYIWLNAEKGSGKTHLMEVLSPIAFNGDLLTSSTEAVIFRDIENNAGTMFIDEAEKMKKADREVHGALMDILKAGFNKSGAAKRVEKDIWGNFIVKKYSAYSPKMLAGIEELDDVLRDRTIRLPILRKKDSESVERFKDTDQVLQTQRNIRDDLYIFALTHAEKIAKIYQCSEEIIPKNIPHLKNRELDIWEPMFVLAHLIDESAGVFGQSSQALEDMLNLSRHCHTERSAHNSVENETVKLLNFVKEMLTVLKPDQEEKDIFYYKIEDVQNYFNSKQSFGYFDSSNSLTILLKKISIESQQKRTESGRGRFYKINKSNLDDLCERYQADFDKD